MKELTQEQKDTFIEEVLSEWFTKTLPNIPDPTNQTHITKLKEVFAERGFNEKFTSAFISNVMNRKPGEMNEL